MKRWRVVELLQSKEACDEILVKGWVRTKRSSKAFSFIELNDGSCLKNIQVIVDDGIEGAESLATVSTGAAVGIVGRLVASPGKGQTFEVQATKIEVYGLADDSYPLQKKGHSLEFLREISHLRPRSNLFGSVFRVRSRLAYAVHQFFQESGFHYIHTPIITSSDCEGAGEMFRVSQFDASSGKACHYKDDFFGQSTFLTVSGQLEGEAFALALSNIYTFGPTFRAENSNTPRHAAEFWMIEPEMAFVDLEENMGWAERFVSYLIKDIVDNCPDEIDLFNKFVDKKLKARLSHMLEKPFVRMTYEKALEILRKSGKKFEYSIEFGAPLQTEHERFLAEQHVKGPVIVYNYPKDCKPFYMRANDDDRTVAAMDVLVPGVGEIIGGSQREERLERLHANMEASGLDLEEYSWYLDTRRFGSAPHSGFGLGFERMLMFVTGIANIRDVIAAPRTPGSISF